jgi:RimJ/RimL family protein N-acetyltransferase
MVQGWAGDKVRLVALDRSRHLDNAVAWFNDPEVTAWTLVGDWPLCRLAEEEFFAVAERASPFATPTDVFLAVETTAGEHIGFTGVHRIDWRHGVGLTGTVIGRKDLWRRGYGSDAVRVRTAYAFDVLGLRLMLSEAFADNEASQRMLLRVGFREVGRVPERYFKRGVWRDIVEFACRRDWWTAARDDRAAARYHGR